MSYCVGRAARQLGDMLLRAVPFFNTFCRDPAPFLSNQRHPPCAGQRCAKIIWKLDTSYLARTVITFAITMEGRQRTVMPNWHDLLVQFKNFITFCLAASTTSSSCADAHFLCPSILVRPQRWSIFQSDGMVNVFCQATIDFNGFSMVLTMLDHHHWMFY